MFHFGVLSEGASSKSFDADADGYARGEAVSMVYIKKLEDAIRDGNPIRAVIRSAVSNTDGKTTGLTNPSGAVHESLIRSAYRAAGLESEIGRTGFFECHATGTSRGDPQEANAVARIFRSHGGVYMGSVKVCGERQVHFTSTCSRRKLTITFDSPTWVMLKVLRDLPRL